MKYSVSKGENVNRQATRRSPIISAQGASSTRGRLACGASSGQAQIWVGLPTGASYCLTWVQPLAQHELAHLSLRGIFIGQRNRTAFDLEIPHDVKTVLAFRLRQGLP